MTKKTALTQIKVSNLPEQNKPLVEAIGGFAVNPKGKLVFKPLSPSQEKSGAMCANYSRYTLREINRIMGDTNLILIDPDQIPEVMTMLHLAHSRKFIPTFYGHVGNARTDGERLDIRNYKTLSFGIFTGANEDRTTTDYIFAYLSQTEDELALEDELEGVTLPSGRKLHIVDALNDMFGVTAGVDYSLFRTIKLYENPKVVEYMKSLGGEAPQYMLDVTPKDQGGQK